MVIKRKESAFRIDKTLSLVRCFEECTEALANNKPLPIFIFYQQEEVYLKVDGLRVKRANTTTVINPTTSSSSTASSGQQDSNLYFFEAPVDDTNVYLNTLNNFEYLNSNRVVDKNMIEYVVTNSAIRINTIGKWILVTKIKVIN